VNVISAFSELSASQFIAYCILNRIKQGVALTGRNTTGPP